MNLPSQKLFLIIASAALVFAGCTKKPQRPDPGATVLGPAGGPGTGATDTTFGTDLPPGLSERTPDWIGNQNRTALAAHTVYFDFDKSDIKASEREKLKAAKEYLDKNPTHKLLLEGHADWRGTAEYNLALGDRRANAAKRYLLSLGVPATRLETISKGSLESAKNADDATMAKDRRVDLIVVDPARGAGAPAI